MPDRLYSESEVAAIIARAAERQRLLPMGDAVGLSLDEIERAGREAGLDPEALRAAAADLDAGLLDPRASLTAVAEEWADGPLHPDAWEDAVAALRLRFGPTMAMGGASRPDARQVGGGVEWVHQSATGTLTTVSASPREGRTRVRVVAVQAGLADPRREGWLAGAFLALVPAMFAGALTAETLGFGDVAGIAAVVVVFALLFAMIAPRVTRYSQRKRDEQAVDVDRLARDLARDLSGPARLGADVEQPAAEADLAPGPRLDLGALDGESAEEAPRVRGPRTRS